MIKAFSTPVEPRKCLSAGLLIGHSLDIKLKQKIWHSFFVEMADIYFDEYLCKGFNLALDEDDPSKFQFKKKERHISHINQWSHPWEIFSAVYVMKPEWAKDMPHLMTYGREICTMAEEGHNWQFYDRKFQKDRASMDFPYPWSCSREDLHRKVHQANLHVFHNRNAPPPTNS